MKQASMIRKNANRKHAKKELTIQGISPNWARILPLIPKTDKSEFYKNGEKLDISDCKYCVVGEAYGFSDDYAHSNKKDFCYDCFSSAINFGYSLLLHPTEREGLTNTFVDHWNSTHL